VTYAVIWKASAEREAARLEVGADDPARIREAVRWTDYALRRYPADMGEGRVPAAEAHRHHLRVWLGDVLAVSYRVDDIAMRVDVLAVGLSRRPRG
jgi:hypothetical protein